MRSRRRNGSKCCFVYTLSSVLYVWYTSTCGVLLLAPPPPPPAVTIVACFLA